MSSSHCEVEPSGHGDVHVNVVKLGILVLPRWFRRGQRGGLVTSCVFVFNLECNNVRHDWFEIVQRFDVDWLRSSWRFRACCPCANYWHPVKRFKFKNETNFAFRPAELLTLLKSSNFWIIIQLCMSIDAYETHFLRKTQVYPNLSVHDICYTRSKFPCCHGLIFTVRWLYSICVTAIDHHILLDSSLTYSAAISFAIVRFTDRDSISTKRTIPGCFSLQRKDRKPSFLKNRGRNNEFDRGWDTNERL